LYNPSIFVDDVNEDALLPNSPLVDLYFTFTILPFASALPDIPSPNTM